MVGYTSQQRVFLCDMKYRSARKCWRKFHDERARSRQTIHNFVNKPRSTWLLEDRKQKHKYWVLTEEKLDDVGARLEHTPRKSLKHLAQETGLSKSSAWRAAHLLKLRPYETTVIHALQLAGFIFADGFYSLLSKVRSIHNWHSFLVKCGFTCRDT
jgi:hypothetical protein